MNKPCIIALDVASRVGWAVSAAPGDPSGPRPISGTFLAKRPAEDAGLAYMGLHAWLDEFIQARKPDLIVYEAPIMFGGRGGSTRPTNHKTVALLNGLTAIVLMTAAECGIRCASANIGAVRRHFVGQGKADKAMVMKQCKLLGWRPQTEDEGDALAIWDWANAHARELLA